MTLEKESLSILSEALEILESSFDDLPAFQPELDLGSLRTVLLETAKKMQQNFPYPHPYYAGQMLKPPHAVARLAYMLSLWVNPNNHALDGGLASSAMEKEVVANLATLFQWQNHLGHLCGGGTMANLEALWIAGKLRPGKKVVASQQAHYTHSRISEVLNLEFQGVPVTSNAQMDLNALQALLDKGDVGTVVVTMGTTSVGAVDPLPDILRLRQRYGFRIHADAAYGGYFHLTDNLDEQARRAFDALAEVDSLVIDPHKHGLQPYGCGCVLFRDPAVGRFYHHDSPYTYFTSDDLHLGEISLECSRPGAAAVALWATQKLFPMVPNGEFARSLSACRSAALGLFERLQKDPRFLTAFPPQLDIVIWGPKAKTAQEMSHFSQRIFQAAAGKNLHLAIAKLPQSLLEPYWPDFVWDSKTVTLLRSCLMKPEHLAWLDSIWETLSALCEPILKPLGD